MEKKTKLINIVILYGILFALLLIIYILMSANIKSEGALSNVLGLILLVLFVLIPFFAVRTYKDQIENIGLGQAVKVGVWVGLAGGFLGGLYAIGYYKFINPDMAEQLLQISRERFEKMEKNTYPEYVDEQMEMVRNLFIPMQLIARLFIGLLFGAIGGVIGGLVYKSDSQEY